MTEVPHIFVVATVEIDGRSSVGMSADGLPPKWFTKNPDTTFDQDDLPMMLAVIKQAASLGLEIGSQNNFFQWWYQLYERQQAWARRHEIAPLLAGLGVSLMERAVLDATLRNIRVPLAKAIRNDLLGIQLSALRPELGQAKLRDLLPESPSPRVYLRHTVGLGDPLADADAIDAPQDGLPFTLEQNIQAYGLRYFKIKLSGNMVSDYERLQRIATIVARTVGADARFTLDGNENYKNIEQFQQAWHRFQECAVLREFFQKSLMFVEQPIHRDQALDHSVGEQLSCWRGAPAIIIDESDAELGSLPQALQLGYRGTSHKNCKGIIKGCLAAATIARESLQRNQQLILSAEDLGNVPPIALLQDLAAVACLGIPHVERNGHHYFAGLSMFPQSIQQQLVECHGDLFQWDGLSHFAKLAPRAGTLSLETVNQADFGLVPLIDLADFRNWEF